MRTIHVRNQGVSHDLTFDDLALNETATDREILQRVANHLDKDLSVFDGHYIDRSQSNALTIRPNAVFG